MAPDSRSPSPKASESSSDQPSKEDAETTAAREELRNTSISELDKNVRRLSTPDPDRTQRETKLRDLVSSPKKKRARDQLDANDHSGAKGMDVGGDNEDCPSGPEKKRHRDEHSPTSSISETTNEKREGQPTSNRMLSDIANTGSSFNASDGARVKNTSISSAFADSSFSKLTSTTSPFGALGSSSQGSAFGSAAPKSAFASLGSDKPSLNFSHGTNSSPFLALTSVNSNGLGASFGSPFAAGTPGKLASFATPGETLKRGVKSRPFGAPDSDSDAGSSGDTEDDVRPDDEDKGAKSTPEKDETKAFVENRKKMKLQRVPVDDGEAGETTIIQVRAKMYYIDNDNKESGWKERGAGILKINVPESCVDFDESGNPISGTFDASSLDEEYVESTGIDSFKGARLIMRQDQTHRLILNTVLLPAMAFQEKASLKAVNIMFTAFESGPGERRPHPLSVNMKMSAANARTFMNEVSIVQRELRGA